MVKLETELDLLGLMKQCIFSFLYLKFLKFLVFIGLLPFWQGTTQTL